MKKLLIVICILVLLNSLIAGNVKAASLSGPQAIVVYSAIVLAAVEGANLLYHGVRYLINRDKKQPDKHLPPVQTNVIPIETNILITAETNIIVEPITNIIADVKRFPLSSPELIQPENAFVTTNQLMQFIWSSVPSDFPPVYYRLVIDDMTNIITGTNHFQEFELGRHRWWVQALEEATNAGIKSRVIAFTVMTNRPLFTSTSIFSNLSESEQEDIRLFGPDYYYQVSLAYYKVKKYEKSREFMFHSLAIGMMVEEGTLFLKEKFKLTDKQIQDGILRYRNSQ